MSFNFNLEALKGNTTRRKTPKFYADQAVVRIPQFTEKRAHVQFSNMACDLLNLDTSVKGQRIGVNIADGNVYIANITNFVGPKDGFLFSKGNQTFPVKSILKNLGFALGVDVTAGYVDYLVETVADSQGIPVVKLTTVVNVEAGTEQTSAADDSVESPVEETGTAVNTDTVEEETTPEVAAQPEVVTPVTPAVEEEEDDDEEW